MSTNCIHSDDCDQWVKACNNSELDGISSDKLLKHYSVCSEHFSNESFTRLLPNSIQK